MVRIIYFWIGLKKLKVTFRSFNGKEISNQEFERYKMILESEDRDIEDGLKECTFSLTIPRCK